MDNSENLKLLELALKNDILDSSDMEKIKESMKKKTLEKLKNELKPLHPPKRERPSLANPCTGQKL